MVTKEDLEAYIAHNRSLKIPELRHALFLANPLCYYCKKLTRELQFGNLKKGQRYPDDMATIEHLFDKFEPEKRYRVYPNNEDKVLACFKCNTERGNQKILKYGKDLMEERSRKGAERRRNKDTTPRVFYLNDLPY